MQVKYKVFNLMIRLYLSQ